MTSTLEVKNEVCTRRGAATDGALMEEFLVGLSPRSFYLRFLTGFGPGALPRLVKHLLVPEEVGGSLLAFRDGTVVGHGMWAPAPDLSGASGDARPAAEIGIVVADAYQGQGIGSRLVDDLVGWVACRGLTEVQAVVSAENQVVRRMITGRVSDVRYTRDGPLITATAAAHSLL
ncbi:GNAT family N-acetyltransferase [Mumia zhuanghuii]|uniref:GNAT family N-acetyltransferase n=1 Tax=Mumia zhuanghuii TaxID=2585211 RepID=A0A5C4N3H2_9ACTN|nr:GNAT family N-acetyltransferase [Mumia zhuanghuii]TNC51379.1 GNAT family N-acetyltransferase [Mumia zhuanghuii]